MDIKIEPNESVDSYAQYSKNEIPIVRSSGGSLISTPKFEKHCNDVDCKREPLDLENNTQPPKYTKQFCEYEIPIIHDQNDSGNDSMRRSSNEDKICTSSNLKPYLEIQIDEVEVKMESPNPEEAAYDRIDDCGIRLNRLSERVARIKLDRVPLYTRYFVCGVCYGVFPTSVEQERHNSTHQQFISRSSFERYAKKKIKRFRTGVLEKRLRKCDKCDYSSVKSSYMKKHQMIHSDEKAFKCRACVYSCTQLSTIKIHEMTHSGERPLKCDECEFSCIQISTFKRHKMIHSGEKPFKCDKCEYSCIQVNNFKRHAMIHSGEKPFKCKECEYSCISPGNMKKHNMIHSGDKPFKCEQCDYSCIQMNNLKRHKMTHSGEKSFKCNECDYSCIVSSNFKRHRKIHVKKKIV